MTEKDEEKVIVLLVRVFLTVVFTFTFYGISTVLYTILALLYDERYIFPPDLLSLGLMFAAAFVSSIIVLRMLHIKKKVIKESESDDDISFHNSELR